MSSEIVKLINSISVQTLAHEPIALSYSQEIIGVSIPVCLFRICGDYCKEKAYYDYLQEVLPEINTVCLCLL